MKADQKSVVESVISSLLRAPSEWNLTAYLATHSSGVEVWIGNDGWGLSIRPVNDRRSIGGVCAIGWRFIGWRRRIWKAVRAHPEFTFPSDFGPFGTAMT